MWKNKTIAWHRPTLEFQLDDEVAVLEIDGESIRCAFPLFLKAANTHWAVGVPISQLREPAIDLYVFEYKPNETGKRLSPAPETGFATLVTIVSK